MAWMPARQAALMLPQGRSVLLEAMPYGTHTVGFSAASTTPLRVERVKLCGTKQFGMEECAQPAGSPDALNACRERNMFCFRTGAGKWVGGVQERCDDSRRSCECVKDVVFDALHRLYYGKAAPLPPPPNRAGPMGGSLDPDA
jgi:hypothetical protein